LLVSPRYITVSTTAWGRPRGVGAWVQLRHALPRMGHRLRDGELRPDLARHRDQRPDRGLRSGIPRPAGEGHPATGARVGPPRRPDPPVLRCYLAGGRPESAQLSGTLRHKAIGDTMPTPFGGIATAIVGVVAGCFLATGVRR